MQSIYNFLQIDERWASAGQATIEQFQAVKAAGYEVVINLAPSDVKYALPDEGKIITDLGMDYIHIPVIWTEPTAENLDVFFAAMDAHQDEKILVHCIANMRATAFCLLYRVIRQGVDLSEAKASMNQIWQTNPTWQDFLQEQLDRFGVDTSDL